MKSCSPESFSCSPNDARFHQAMAYIDTHYMGHISLDQVAGIAGLSRFYFSRMFKKETGFTFKKYLTRRRLNAAKKMITKPGRNISEICYSVGFNDLSYFARTFRQYEGTSPTGYRNRLG